ncbi:MAG TPA: hypothetical protein VKK79_14560, partial [Candidatus Lokiarchaeia archaeon]|nr:hypothetical protein [Candidatus Lokiarchaeia archaeon]
MVDEAILNPDEVFEDELGFVVHKIIIDPISEKKYLLRVFYQETSDEVEVISAYKTRKITKYWRGNFNED